MPWLKNTLVDLLVPIVIAALVFLDQRWAWWVLVVYTPLMLLMKGIAAFSGGVRSVASQRRTRSEPPVVFYHALYALDVALLAVGREWLLAAGWVVIWALSAYAARR